MIIKKFVAPTMPEAMSKVKKEFGDQAVILKTRMNRKAGGQSNFKGVEITAAVESDSKSRFKLQTDGKPETKTTVVESTVPEQPSVYTSEKLDSLIDQVADLKKAVDEKSNRQMQSFFGNLSADMLEAGRELIRRNISEELAFAIISRLVQSENSLNLGRDEINKRIEQIFCSMLSPGEPIDVNKAGTTTVMFVGPTGSGKTAAIARVAMLHKIEEDDKVAIITADNFRADSSQQIKSYCRIIGCPCGVIYTPEELSIAIRSQKEGLILIDTSGISPNDDKEIGEMQSLIRSAKPHEIHLVVPASTPARDLSKMLTAFGEFGIDKIFLTKLDETDAPGGVITAVIDSGKKLSYVSRSREIPGQFGVAVPESLAKALIAEIAVEEIQPKWEMEAVGIWQ